MSTSNVTSDGTVYYGIDTANIAEQNTLLFGVDEIQIFDHTGDGVFAGMQDDNTSGWWTSRTIAKTVDLICEGEIEGIVSGEWVPTEDDEADPPILNELGQIGWKQIEFVPYANGTEPECWLRSIFLNDTPVVTKGGFYNFTNIEAAISNGAPQGIEVGDRFLNIGETNKIEKTRVINERLLGPDENTDENVLKYNNKVYRILNREVEKIRVNIKIPQLSYSKTTPEWEPTREELRSEVEDDSEKEFGEIIGSKLNFRFRFKPIFRNAIEIGIDLNSGVNWSPVTGEDDGVVGLIRQPYMHQVILDLKSFPDLSGLPMEHLIGWDIEVVRITKEAFESNVQNQSYIDSLTEVFENTLAYPHSALASCNFNAQYFSQVPNRAFDIRLKKVKIPTGYNPLKKSYPVDANDNPNWDGTFQTQKKWTDNPAWIFYDLLTDARYGLGKFIDNLTIDKWTLWEISKYCDTLVANADGELEPRFTCNVYINTREEAFKVLQDFASIFRGMIYYGMGNIHAVQDRPKEAIAHFTAANVLDGDFSYSSTAKKARATVAIVRYNDKFNQYKPAVEFVENVEAIRKYGYVEKELTAFACTSKTQAIRLGRWILATELYEREVIKFSTGPEAMFLRPGDVVKVSDSNRHSTSAGGRITDINSTATSITLDKPIDHVIAEGPFRLALTTPTYFYDTSIVDTEDPVTFNETAVDTADMRRPQVQTTGVVPSDTASWSLSNVVINTGAAGDIYGTKIEQVAGVPMFNTSLTEINEEATWTALSNDFAESFYTVIGIGEESTSQYSVEGVHHLTGKFPYIDENIPIDTMPTYGGTTVRPPGPQSVLLSTIALSTNTKRIKIDITPPSNLGSTIGYKIYIKRCHALDTDGSNNPTCPENITFTSDELSYGNVPREDLYFTTIYMSQFSNVNPYVYYLPPTNKNRYVIRVFAINGTALMSNMYAQPTSILISEHYPVKDVKIHSLRLNGQMVQEDPDAIPPVVKTSFGQQMGKDAHFIWDVDYPVPEFSSLDLQFYVSIHTVNPGSATPKLPQLWFAQTEEPRYKFPFEKNLNIPGGPYRHYDLVVRAQDEFGVKSTETFSSQGWDIVEVDNPRPEGYRLTPRKSYGPGNQIAGDPLTTDQYIDANGNIVVRFLASSWADLAGGFIYISQQPFSGGFDGDFNQYNNTSLAETTGDFGGEGVHHDGEPDNYNRLEYKLVGDEKQRTGEFYILQVPFEADRMTDPNGKETLGGQIVVHPNSVGNCGCQWPLQPNNHNPLNFSLSNSYYMAIKLYDTFDAAVKQAYEGGGYDHLADWDEKLDLGWVRHNTDPAGNIQMTPYAMYGGVGNYLANTNVGTPDVNGTGLFSCPILPRIHYSANAEGGFKYWLRLNVNGQWEGNGISHVKALTDRDVKEYYDYDGFFEYACVMTHKGDSDGVYYPNHGNSQSRCRFRQGTYNPETHVTSNIDGSIEYSPGAPDYKYVTGGVKVPDGWVDYVEGNWPKAGVPLTQFPAHDWIPSYNELGQQIQGKSRPLRGFRRFRVYFDEFNLPPEAQANELSPYDIIGINAWNGPYESYPASVQEITGSVFAAKDFLKTVGYDQVGDVFGPTVRSWMKAGDLFENIPGVWNHHPAGFGAGFGGLIKERRYFDVHMGRMIDDSYLNQAFFGVVTKNDYSIREQEASWDPWYTDLHTSSYSQNCYVYNADEDQNCQ